MRFAIALAALLALGSIVLAQTIATPTLPTPGKPTTTSRPLKPPVDSAPLVKNAPEPAARELPTTKKMETTAPR